MTMNGCPSTSLYSLLRGHVFLCPASPSSPHWELLTCEQVDGVFFQLSLFLFSNSFSAFEYIHALIP